MLEHIQVGDDCSETEDTGPEQEESEGDEVYGVTSALNLTHHKVRDSCFNFQC